MLTPVRLGISQGHGGASVVTGARTFAEALGDRLGRPVRLLVTSDYPELLRSLLGGGIDLGWMPPFLHIEAVAAGATLVTVCRRDGALTYRSAIIVGADGPLRRLEDIVGLRVAWTDRSSASGFVFPRLHLVASGVDPRRGFASEEFLGSPRAVCSAVAEGSADLGACFTSEAHAGSIERTLADVTRIYPPARWRLRVLRVTDSIPADGMVAGAHVDAGLREQLIDGMLAFHERPDGRAALATLLFADRLVRVDGAVERLVARLRPMVPALRAAREPS